MSKNREAFNIIIDMLVVWNKMGIGISRTISMSNTMKIIASRKNRMENGTRAL